jgi:hypothetical protein
MSKQSTSLMIAIYFAIAIAAICPAQVEQGSITGVVTDPSNASVGDAKVTVTNIDTQVATAMNTNSQGNYGFPFLPPGHYAVLAEKEGFSNERVTNITITLDSRQPSISP